MHNNNRIVSNNITEGVIWKQLLIFFFPLLLGSFFQQLYNTADAVVVGQFVGKEALSAVGGTTGTLINLFVGFFVGTSTGATVTISQYYGAKQEVLVGKAVHTAMALAIVGGVVIMLLGIVGAPLALKLMRTPDEIMPYSLTYIRIYFGGMIANLVYNVGTGILRAIGDSKRPLYFLIGSCGINIVLDLLFVIVFRWDVMGVAVATVISQICSAVMICYTLMRTTNCYRLYVKQIRVHKDLLVKIIKIGLPAGFQSLMYTTSNIIIQSNMNSFGTDTIAAWTAYGKIDGIFWMTMGAFGISITTFVGQNYGAGKDDRVRKGIRVCFIMAMAVAIGMSLALYFSGTYVYQLFSKEDIVIEKGLEILHFMAPTFFTYVSIEILSGSLRGMGNAFIPMLITCLGVCALRIIWLFAIVPLYPNVKTVIFSYPLTWVTTSILFILYYAYYMKKQKYRVSI
ncbi:MAG: family efflux transporter [Herbinix sp.]|jgi:putative MATE family efflux protein|nr:family efflux transporter [Herbinix sp.]